MSDIVAAPQASVELTVEPNNASAATVTPRRLPAIVIGSILLSSIAAYASGLLIFDEVRWYRIDKYDGFVWGWIVIQTFAVAQYGARIRVETFAHSVRMFAALGLLAVGLTLAAIGFLSVDALQNKESLLPILSISGGYLSAVFIFLVAMFLQFRLALAALKLLGSSLRCTASSHQHGPETNTTSAALATPQRYPMADVFALTGLSAVCITAFQLTRNSMTDSDTVQLLSLFYAAAVIAMAVYGIMELRLGAIVKWVLCATLVCACSLFLHNMILYFKSPLRFQYSQSLTVMWGLMIACAAALHTWVIDWQVRRNNSGCH